jgi:hypothetical protein
MEVYADDVINPLHAFVAGVSFAEHSPAPAGVKIAGIPFPAARNLAAIVPCGTNSTSSCPLKNMRSKFWRAGVDALSNLAVNEIIRMR